MTFLNERQAVCEIRLNRVSWTNTVGLQSAEGLKRRKNM